MQREKCFHRDKYREWWDPRGVHSFIHLFNWSFIQHVYWASTLPGHCARNRENNGGKRYTVSALVLHSVQWRRKTGRQIITACWCYEKRTSKRVPQPNLEWWGKDLSRDGRDQKVGKNVPDRGESILHPHKGKRDHRQGHFKWPEQKYGHSGSCKEVRKERVGKI